MLRAAALCLSLPVKSGKLTWDARRRFRLESQARGQPAGFDTDRASG